MLLKKPVSTVVYLLGVVGRHWTDEDAGMYQL